MNKDELKGYIEKIKIKIGIEEEKLKKGEKRLKNLNITDNVAAEKFLKELENKIKSFKKRKDELEEKLNDIFDDME